jgi:hypothetical protein
MLRFEPKVRCSILDAGSWMLDAGWLYPIYPRLRGSRPYRLRHLIESKTEKKPER